MDGVDTAILLLVEDDELVREITADLLSDLGYVVREADCAKAALASLEDVTVLITDIGLPDGDGRDLARLARDRVPGIAVVIATGEIGEEDGTVWLTKPYNVETLRAALLRAQVL